MDYRMITLDAAAGKNVVELIKKQLENTEKFKLPNFKLNFIGFEAEPGTEFYLNTDKNKMKVPSSGNFITPFNGERGMLITSLKFVEDFSGDIYYIY